MRWIFLLAAVAACSPVDQRDSRTVAAIEVPLDGEDDREALVTMLRRHAHAAGFHVDDGSDRWRRFEAEANQIAPDDRLTVNVGVWSNSDDAEAEALADDRFHPGRAWVTFPRGSQPDRSRRFREPLLAEIGRRWPRARSIPILPGGTLPLADDMVMTRDGYRIAPAAAARYGLPASSPILAAE